MSVLRRIIVRWLLPEIERQAKRDKINFRAVMDSVRANVNRGA